MSLHNSTRETSKWIFLLGQAKKLSLIHIYVAGRHLGRVVFHNGHHGFLKAPAAVQILDEVHNGRAEAVSYTHLDVYKRQALTLLAITAVVAVILAAVNTVTAPRIAAQNEQKTQTVSYTHL